MTFASVGSRALNFFRLLLALAVFAASLLTIFPAPTYLAWQLSIGATEWGHVLAVIALLIAFLPGWTRTPTSRMSAFIALLAMLLALTPLLQASPIARELSAQLASAFGGRNPRDNASAAAAMPAAPLAPCGWPIIDLIDEPGTRSACGPNTRRTHRDSIASFSWVDVP